MTHTPIQMPELKPCPLKWLEDNCYDLRCVDCPTGGDDSDVGWRVISHHMDKPNERVEGYGSTPIQALEDAGYTRAASVPSEGTIHSVGIDALIADAMKKEMSPDDIEQQRQSWIRGQTGCDETTTVQPPSDKERAEALRWASEICMQSDKTAPSMRKSNQHLNQIYATIERALTAPDQSVPKEIGGVEVPRDVRFCFEKDDHFAIDKASFHEMNTQSETIKVLKEALNIFMEQSGWRGHGHENDISHFKCEFCGVINEDSRVDKMGHKPKCPMTIATQALVLAEKGGK